jgi:hypothetical protein
VSCVCGSRSELGHHVGVQLQFGPDDNEAFVAAKQEILVAFGTWAVQRYGDDDGSLVADADTFLSWRFDYSTGDLSDFDIDDVEEFLLGWAPRKFSVGPEEAPVLCRAVELMIEFLAITGRLKGGKSRAARIMAHVDGLVDEVTAALGNESNFGLAKGVLGLDLSDSSGNPLADVLSMLESDDPPSPEELEAVLNERMDAFNSLPMEERVAITDPLLESREPPPIELPFMLVPPSAAEVEASAGASRLLGQVDGLVRHLGDSGLKLTQTGNLRLADARELVELLDTGDEMDPVVYDRVEKTRTSLELRWLTLVEDVAVLAGAAKRLKTKLNANPQWLDLPVVERASSVIGALLYMGPLGSKPTRHRSPLEDIDDLLDEGVPHWFAGLLPNESSVEFDELVQLAHQVVELRFASDYAELAAIGSDEFIDYHMSELFDTLVRAGIIEWSGRTEARSEFGWVVFFKGGELSLTALGRHAMPDFVRAAGYELSTVDDLASASPVVVLNAVATASVTEDEALGGWRPDESTGSRARLIVEGALAAEHPAQRITAFSLLRKLDPVEEVAPVVRELLDSSCSGHAAFFLLDTGQATSDEVGMFISIGPMIDLLYSEIDSPEHLDQLFIATQARSEVDLLEDIWRHDQPETIELLEALGRHLTDKKMAKAARKAAFKHRSWLANEGR